MDLKKEEISNLTYDELLKHIHASWEHDNKEKYKEISQSLKEELGSREPTVGYECPKCHYKEHKESQIRAAGGGFSALFDIQTEKFRVITCKRCNYSEMYKRNTSIGQQALDWVVGG